MSTVPKDSAEKKWSVYISLLGAIFVGTLDLVLHQTIDASLVVVVPLLTFATGRQIVKSAVGK